MDREIKFRGWNKKNKKWVSGYYLKNRSLHFVVADEFATPEKTWEDYEVEEDSVGQYVGVKDKNGIEIYEGDMLLSEHYPFKDNGKPNYYGVVEWIDCNVGFEITTYVAKESNAHGISDGINMGVCSDDLATLYEVVGNVYDNKDLLKYYEL